MKRLGFLLLAFLLMGCCNRGHAPAPSGIYCWDAGYDGRLEHAHCWMVTPGVGCQASEHENRKCPQWITDALSGR